MKKINSVKGLVIIVLVCSQVCLAGNASFRGLGDLPGRSIYSEVFAVSAYGNAAVGWSSSTNGDCEAFRWMEATGMVGLGDLPGEDFYSWACGVSCDGTYVAGFGMIYMGTPFRYSFLVPCRWSGPNNIQRLGQSSQGGCALGISADGLTVIGVDCNSSCEAFIWTEVNGMQGLGCLPGGNTDSVEPLGISADGRVVVGDSPSTNGPYEAFRWTQATGMIGLGDLPGGNFSSVARDISADGLVIVGSACVGSSPWKEEAFIWTESGGMRGLGQLPSGSNYSSAYAVSGDGTIVVGDANRCAFIWDANHGMQRLKDVLENAYNINLTGWILSEARDISADGRTIVGNGKDPNGNSQAWMAVLGDPPPPSYKFTVKVEPNDIGINTVTPGIGEHIYYKGWPVVLKAETFKKCPYVYRFSHWTGGVSDPNAAIATIVMTEDKTVTAVYYADQRRCGDECHPILQGDLNKDCYINFEDFAIYCEHWLSCTHPDCD